MHHSTDIVLTQASDQDLDAIASFIFDHLQKPENQCLHSWSGESRQELSNRLCKDFHNHELQYTIAQQSDEIVGFIGCEYDEELGQGWLHGPFSVLGSQLLLYQPMFDQLMQNLPTKIEQLNAFLNLKNNVTQQFYQQNGFTRKQHSAYEYSLGVEATIPCYQYKLPMLTEPFLSQFGQIFTQIFPTAYCSAERIWQNLNQIHAVYLAIQDERVVGFSVVELHATMAEIQFLGVLPAYRGQGIGKNLLLHSIHWLQQEKNLQHIRLNVDESLEAAINLYMQCGFRLQFAGIGYYRTRNTN